MRPSLFVAAYIWIGIAALCIVTGSPLPGLISGVAALYFGCQSGYGPLDFVRVFKELTK